MLNKVYLLPVALLIFLISCTVVEESNFELPKTVQLSTYSLFDPMFVEEFLEAPLKSGNIWNDSLISLCRINKIQFVYKGEKNPDNIAETHINLFNQHGQIKEYSYSNFELSKNEFTKINFEYTEGIMTSINSSIFFGQKKNQNVNIQRNDEGAIFIKNGTVPDSTFIYSKNGQITVIVEKLGDFISKINFVLDMKKPVVSVKSCIKLLNISDDQFLTADRYLTFTDKGMPQKSYHLTENLVKEYLSNEWIYENNKKLIGFKKYINNQVVKEFSFIYAEDKLMKSFTFNKKVYEIKYN